MEAVKEVMVTICLILLEVIVVVVAVEVAFELLAVAVCRMCPSCI